GSAYSYNSGASQILSAILEETTGYSTFDFAMKYLFDPLGITETDVTWVTGADGINHGGVGIFITPRNMAKFGQLLLNNGTWDGTQIISSSWIEQASQNHIDGIVKVGMPRPSGYGYQFWLDSSTITGDYFFALGYGGQTIQIFPEHELVIVTTARQDEFTARTIGEDVIVSCIPGFVPHTESTSQNSSWAALPWLVFPGLICFAILRKKRKQGTMNW
ncbi:MAG: serine hydrolase domain-containing protein, partial [Candidatus Hodarchaeales archaeon]